MYSCLWLAALPPTTWVGAYGPSADHLSYENRLLRRIASQQLTIQRLREKLARCPHCGAFQQAPPTSPHHSGRGLARKRETLIGSLTVRLSHLDPQWYVIWSVITVATYCAGWRTRLTVFDLPFPQ